MKDLAGHSNLEPFAPECIEPELGEQLWRLDDAECDAPLRAELELHLEFCAACRLSRAVTEKTAAGLADGSLQARGEAPSRGRVIGRIGWFGWTGAAALAASVALMLLLPPTAKQAGMTMRGDEAPAITTPVPDEVITTVTPQLRWTPIDGATRYRVTVEGADSGYRWETTTTDSGIRVAQEDPLPGPGRYRVSVDAIPDIYAPPEGLHTSFRNAGRGAWLIYRVGHGPTGAKALGAAGLLGLLAALGGTLIGGRGRG